MELNKLYLGDCIEGLKNIKDGTINLVLNDPPYNISKENNFKSMGRNGIDFGEWDKNYNICEHIKSLSRITSKDGSVIIFNDWRNLGKISEELEKNGFVVKDMLRWEKTNPIPRNRDRRYVTDYEMAIWAVKKNSKWTFNRCDRNYQRPKFIYSVVSGKHRIHPTQKPIKLMEEIIRIHSNEGDTILDCFMGSATTAIACMNTKRNFIGFELDVEMYKKACLRIDDHITK